VSGPEATGPGAAGPGTAGPGTAGPGTTGPGTTGPGTTGPTAAWHEGAEGFGACSADPDGGCLTCGDVAVPLTVVGVRGADACCRDDAGRTETVALELVGPVDVGDRLLVHAGVAIELLTAAAPPSMTEA
jgi:hydrogenase maturation factor